ncbi:hypothetical protein SmJEL517_g01516 [Synchytrium microbalum]|uniref:Kinesin-like protein n=1 Tax=Synchytrium microbalum TaxID=1806994 RepID=A0A507CFH4_9FUNG|nr:uncharacterized protein SmJEL517_g01516 [Synchytrium microbalum]TPX36335.1 hypothetical protein SmJEL517_g01516 [Synchytrium microbalum]
MEDDGSARVIVAVRIRPLNKKESTEGGPVVARCLDPRTLLVTHLEDEDDVLRKDRPREKLFSFDHVFSEYDGTMDVFDKTTRYLVDAVTKGYNATVFAYGATGAGKTHTMLGTELSPGLMPLTLVHLFQSIRSQRECYQISLSYLEIYNENIRDLLSNRQEYLELRDDGGKKGPVVSGITTVAASSAEEILSFLRKGNQKRTQEATGANETSSRSHAVLQVFVSFRKRPNDDERLSKLSLIDLAGSERAARTNNRGQRLIEGANINRSLLALANCIVALAENGFPSSKYINFRDSKLTRLLKDSLGGNCRTAMIANVSPSFLSIEETMNTIKYASRARAIKTTSTLQGAIPQTVANRSANEMTSLKTEIAQLRARLSVASQQQPPLPPQQQSYLPKALPASYGRQPIINEEVHSKINARIALTTPDSDVLSDGRRKIELLFAERVQTTTKISELEQQQDVDSGVKSQGAKKLTDIDREIGTILQQSLSKCVDRKSKMYLELLVRSNYLECENSDLRLFHKLAMPTIISMQVQLNNTVENDSVPSLPPIVIESNKAITRLKSIAARMSPQSGMILQSEQNDRPATAPRPSSSNSLQQQRPQSAQKRAILTTLNSTGISGYTPPSQLPNISRPSSAAPLSDREVLLRSAQLSMQSLVDIPSMKKVLKASPGTPTRARTPNTPVKTRSTKTLASKSRSDMSSQGSQSRLKK